jgi:F0F1-type ATP synthase delta subunit
MSLSRKLAQLIVEKNIAIDDVVESLRVYNLLSLLPSLQEQVERLISYKQADELLHVESPFPLSDEALLSIKKIVGDTNIPHEVHNNTNLLAGFKARYKGILYDGSAERIIKQLMN